MADEVIDIVTRLSYEVDNAPITGNTQALQKTATEVDKLLQSLSRLNKAYEATADTEITKRASLQKAMDNRLDALQKELTMLGRIAEAATKAGEASAKASRFSPVAPGQSGFPAAPLAPRPGVTPSVIRPGNPQPSPLPTPTPNDIALVNRYSGAQFALMQIIREAPSAAVGLQVFFLAISNNIPILVDQIQRLRAAGVSSGDIFANLASSFFSMNNLITIGITLLTVFGGTLLKSGKSAEQAAVDYKKITDSLLEIINGVNEVNVAVDKVFNERAAAARGYAELIKAQGVTAGNVYDAEEKQLKATQEARRAQNDVIRSQLDLYKQIENIAVNKRRGGSDVQETDLAALIPNAEDRKKAVADIQEIDKASRKAGENIGGLRIRVQNLFFKDFIKLQTEYNDNQKQNDLDQVAFETKIREQQYALEQQLNNSLREQRKSIAIERIDLETTVSGQTLANIKKRIDTETAYQIQQINVEETNARKEGTLSAANEAKFAQERNNIRKAAQIQYKKESFELITAQIRAEIQLYAEMNNAELGLSNKQLKNQIDTAQDTYAQRQEIAQRETITQRDEVNRRYDTLFETARRNNVDTLRLTKDYEDELEQVNIDGSRRSLAVEEAYFNDVKKLIDQQHQYELHAITANSRNIFTRRQQTLRENLRDARAELNAANAYGARVVDNPESTKADIDKAADAINVAQTKVIDSQRAITQAVLDNVSKVVGAYATMQNAIIGVFQEINNRQIEMYDREVQYRTERVAYAVELAKRGNTQVLEDEQKRLDEVTQARERAADRQVELNAIVQASNSAVALSEAIGAVVKAAAEGDPYTIAARVAAAVAALVAGVAAVSAAFRSANGKGYAEGGYTGDGGKYEPAGTVHKGEFVMSKEKTSQYRPVLESMLAGAYPVTLRGDIQGVQGMFATRSETEKLGYRLDAINDTLQNMKPATMSIDRRGVAAITQELQNENRRRNKA